MSGTRPILAPREIRELRRFAAADVLLVFDYDGTLAPIAPTPERAALPAATRELLQQAAARYPTAAVSGRALADISARLAGTGIRDIFGNHGMEGPGAPAAPAPQVHAWLAPLHQALDGLPGVMIEDKRHSLSVHYRAAPDHAATLARLEPIVRALPGVRVIVGAAALNLLPGHATHKGAALRRALEMSGRDRAIYVGDDGTDEDAFGALPPDRLLAIRVGAAQDSKARFHLASQPEIDRLLQTLIDLRPRSDDRHDSRQPSERRPR